MAEAATMTRIAGPDHMGGGIAFTPTDKRSQRNGKPPLLTRLPTPRQEHREGDGARKMANMMIMGAFHDMNRKEPERAVSPHAKNRIRLRRQALRENFGQRVRNCAFLVSSTSVRWFDIAGVDQQVILERSGWSKTASELFKKVQSSSLAHLRHAGIRPSDIRLIRGGLMRMGRIEA